MNSTEEYLDSLLRAAMESDEDNTMGPVEAYREDMITGVDVSQEDKEVQTEASAMMESMSSDPNKPLSPEEIEAMFASFGGMTEEEITSEEPVAVEGAMSDAEKEDLLAELESLAFGTEAETRAEEAGVEDTISELESIAFGSDEAISELEGIAFESDEAVAELESIAFGNDEAISELEGIAFENDEAVAELEGIAFESDEAISELESSASGAEEFASEEVDLFAEPGFMQAEQTNNDLSDLVKEDSGEDLLESMAMDDDDELAEINELLKQSEHDEVMEDDMLAMLEKASSEHEEGTLEDDNFDFFREMDDEALAEDLVQEEVDIKEQEVKEEGQEKVSKKKKKEKRRFFGKKKKVKEEDEKQPEVPQAEDEQLEVVEEEAKAQPMGESEQEMFDLLSQFSSQEIEEDDDFFSQFGDDSDLILSMEDEIRDKEDSNTNSSNQKQAKGFWGRVFELLTEEVEEEEEEIKEKPKKEKKKKGKKAKTENEEIINELEEEDASEENKKKKKKKPKKEKKKKIEDISVNDEKKLPKKMVIRIFVLCFSLLLLIVLISNGLLLLTSLKQARNAFYDKDYASVYENMLGADLNESDSIILEKATLVLRLERKYDSYVSYMNMGNKMYALHALLSGLQLYQELYEEAVNKNITGDFDMVKTLIVDALETSFGVSEQRAFEIIELENAGEYQNALNDILDKM